MPDLGVHVVDMFILAVLVVRAVVFSMFLSGVCSKFRPFGRASRFDFLDFFVGKFGNFSSR